ncbi:MAG: CDP-diacylglycerol--serine O-phosphatidyltransferase [Muribaculaceae bacterium]|nr:CDP-diacylglycerol--serine O-phosphatidyltransferase [Muribaculaceae bacterium]
MKKIATYIPNTITCLNLLCGAMAVVTALSPEVSLWGLSNQSLAFILIAAATAFDFWDGFSARLLKAYSPMGKELDSLSDLVSFGLAPSMLVFALMRGCSSWAIVPFFSLMIVVCGALRLAKFNIDTRQTTSFIGLPIPANAIFWIGALGWINVHGYPGDIVMCVLIAAISLLMVSELKMFSLKFSSWGVRQNVRRYVIILACALFVVTDGLAGLAWTIVLYILISLLGKRTDPDAAD